MDEIQKLSAEVQIYAMQASCMHDQCITQQPNFQVKQHEEASDGRYEHGNLPSVRNFFAHP